MRLVLGLISLGIATGLLLSQNFGLRNVGFVGSLTEAEVGEDEPLAYSNVSTNGGDNETVTVSHTASGTDRLAIACWYMENESSTVSSATYGGEAMTLLDSQAGGGGDGKLWIYYIKQPLTGAQTVSITMDGGSKWALGVVSFTGVNQTTPLGTAWAWALLTVMWIYDKFYWGQEPPGVHERGQWLAKLYVEATALLEKKENETPEETSQREVYEAERREMYRKWDAGDPQDYELWKVTREWSLEELRDILKMMDVKMDVWFFESEVDKPSKAIVEELIEKGIADDERPQGCAVIVKIDEKLGLTKEKYRTNVILRSDGTTLYLTKDLALAKVKFEQYHVDRSVYVVDVRQSLHLQQAFAICWD